MGYTFIEFISYDYFSSLLPFYVKHFTYVRMVNPENIVYLRCRSTKESKVLGRKQKHFKFQCYCSGHLWSLILAEKSSEHCWCLTSVKQNTFIFITKIYIFILTVDWLLFFYVTTWRNRTKVLVASGHCPIRLISHECLRKFEKFFSSCKKKISKQSKLVLKLPPGMSVNKGLWSISLKVFFFSQTINKDLRLQNFAIF